MTRHAILLDVDTGTDDALAILYAVGHPDLDVLGVSCVAGNTHLDQVVINTCKTLDAAGAGPTPVAAGASKPLLERSRDAGHVHGADGLGGLTLPASTRATSTESAVQMLRAQVLAAEVPVTLVALAPQTNVALLLSQHPEVAELLERIVFMGGSAHVGNATAVAEFNVWHDPEAAAIVVNSGVPTTMYGLDVFTRLTVAEAVAEELARRPHPAQRMVGELLQRRRPRTDQTAEDYSGLIGDAGALVLMTRPELFTTRQLPVQVNLSGIGRGQTIVDQRTVAGEDHAHDLLQPWPLIEVALDLDAAQAAQAFLEMINAYAA